uniref:Uncharacterized protein n=1 Tax=Candidatus Methanogaster sp. ANME-2c ERB4 TaxID=2759911 RepID=A0A7G9YED8_9EURY|nr:hypothetical protein KKGFGGCE_00010 [Methanosarcinales archaeon ANME-2c ERB4]
MFIYLFVDSILCHPNSAEKNLKKIGSLESLRDSESELYQINHLFSRSISVLQSSSVQLKL